MILGIRFGGGGRGTRRGFIWLQPSVWNGWQRLQQRGLIVVWPASAQLLHQWAHHVIVRWTGPVDLPDSLSWGPRMNGRTLVAMMTEMHAIWERTPESVWDLPWPLPLHRVRRVGWLQWEDRTLD